MSPQDDKAIDAIVFARHLGREYSRNELFTLMKANGLEDSDLETRLKAILDRKAAAAEARKPHEFPKTGGRVLVENKPTDTWLVYRGDPVERLGDAVLFIDDVASGKLPLPDLRTIRFHCPPGLNPSQFDYLTDLLLRIDRGELKPGHIAFLLDLKQHHRATSIGGVPTFNANSPPMGDALDASKRTFICGRGQEPRDLDALKVKFNKAVAEQNMQRQACAV